MMNNRKRGRGYRQTPERWNSDVQEPEELSERPRRKPKPARDCALTLLEYRDRTEQEMRGKLREREYGAEEIEEAIAFLKEYRYIDDGEYARKYIRTHSGRKSVRRIRGELEQKGIEEELIEAGLAEEPVDEETQIAAWIRKKGYTPGEYLEADQYRKLMAGLARRGYSFDAIRRVMDN